MASNRRRGSLREAFGEDPSTRTDQTTGEPVNTVRETSNQKRGPITETGEVEMVPADKPVNMTFTVTAKERYLWTLELRRRGRSAVSVLRERMNELMEDE